MKRTNDTHNSRLCRMCEFYSAEDLVLFLNFCNKFELDKYDAVTYLDMQTRTEYVTGVETEPTIERMILRYAFLSSDIDSRDY